MRARCRLVRSPITYLMSGWLPAVHGCLFRGRQRRRVERLLLRTAGAFSVPSPKVATRTRIWVDDNGSMPSASRKNSTSSCVRPANSNAVAEAFQRFVHSPHHSKTSGDANANRRAVNTEHDISPRDPCSSGLSAFAPISTRRSLSHSVRWLNRTSARVFAKSRIIETTTNVAAAHAVMMGARNGSAVVPSSQKRSPTHTMTRVHSSTFDLNRFFEAGFMCVHIGNGVDLRASFMLRYHRN
jgi:hypothetical protein